MGTVLPYLVILFIMCMFFVLGFFAGVDTERDRIKREAARTPPPPSDCCNYPVKAPELRITYGGPCSNCFPGAGHHTFSEDFDGSGRPVPKTCATCGTPIGSHLDVRA